MKELYANYTFVDFILDDDFKSWLEGRDLINDRLWLEWFQANPMSRWEAERARTFLFSFRVEEEKLCREEMELQWERLWQSVTERKHMSEEHGKGNSGLGFFTLLTASVLMCGFLMNKLFLGSLSGAVVLLSLNLDNGLLMQHKSVKHYLVEWDMNRRICLDSSPTSLVLADRTVRLLNREQN